MKNQKPAKATVKKAAVKTATKTTVEKDIAKLKEACRLLTDLSAHTHFKSREDFLKFQTLEKLFSGEEKKKKPGVVLTLQIEGFTAKPLQFVSEIDSSGAPINPSQLLQGMQESVLHWFHENEKKHQQKLLTKNYR